MLRRNAHHARSALPSLQSGSPLQTTRTTREHAFRRVEPSAESVNRTGRRCTVLDHDERASRRQMRAAARCGCCHGAAAVGSWVVVGGDVALVDAADAGGVDGGGV
jgi:hypothetical protein